jgi:hypothetical protein
MAQLRKAVLTGLTGRLHFSGGRRSDADGVSPNSVLYWVEKRPSSPKPYPAAMFVMVLRAGSAAVDPFRGMMIHWNESMNRSNLLLNIKSRKMNATSAVRRPILFGGVNSAKKGDERS